MADHIWEAESETSLPDDREESEISLPASDRCPDLGKDSNDDDSKDYLELYLPPDDDHESRDESEIGLPDDVDQCCAKQCTNNSEAQGTQRFSFQTPGCWCE